MAKSKQAKPPGKAKALVMQPLFRSRQETPRKGKGSYRRNASRHADGREAPVLRVA